MAVLEAFQHLANVVYQLCVQLPVSALTIPRQRPIPSSVQRDDVLPAADEVQGISSVLCDACQSGESVSSMLAADPSVAPVDAWRRLCDGHARNKKEKSKEEKHERRNDENKGLIREEDGSGPSSEPTKALERARLCGNWGGAEPSELFLQVYNDALGTLEDDLTQAMVSPSLMGTSGVLPLTVISVVPDIARHMANLIVRAEKEVTLATNYWQNSVASGFITEAMRELSRRAGQRGGPRVVIKVMYDRGSARQVLDPRQPVGEGEYATSDGGPVGLPPASEIPHVDLEVMNYHQPVLGTFHAKYLIVDRRAALLQSNNVQDSGNLEMMLHLEGPVVDSLYDMALISWGRCPNPPLPCASAAAAVAAGQDTAEGSFSERHARLFNSDGTLADLEGAAQQKPLPEHTAQDPHYDEDLAGEVARVQASVSASPGESRTEAVTKKLNHTVNPGFQGTAAAAAKEDEEEPMTPYVPHPAHEPFPIALVCRPPYGPPNHGSVTNPQNAAWLSALRHARESVFIQTPTLNAQPLVPAIAEACERGIDVHCSVCLGYNDAGELLPMQGGHNEMVARLLHERLSDRGRARLHYSWYVARDQTTPVAHRFGRRPCHLKLLIADGHVGVAGSGNQDTQSWFHSQEVNVMVDSPAVCAAWSAALRRNQNTGRYGGLDSLDGVWRDAEGREVAGAMGADPGRLSWARGIVGAVKRAKGTGGF